MESLLKGNFPTKEVLPDDPKPVDPKEEFLEKAKASIGGSMVFLERKLKYWSGEDDGTIPATPVADS